MVKYHQMQLSSAAEATAGEPIIGVNPKGRGILPLTRQLIS